MNRLRKPKNLKVDELVKIFPVGKSQGLEINTVVGFHKDKVHFICESIYRGMEELDLNMVHKEKSQPYFVPLSTKILQYVMSSHSYKGILLWMELAGIIIADNSWKKDVVSQGYRFTDKYLFSDFVWRPVKLALLLKKDIEQSLEETVCYEPEVYTGLKKFFECKLLKIDSEKADEVIDLQLTRAIEESNGNLDKIRQARLNTAADIRKVELINSGKYLMTQDNTGYRIHTSLTQLPKTLRNLVTYDGHPLVEIDLSCSQLYFSNFLMDKDNWNIKTENQNIKAIWDGIKINDSNIENKSGIRINYNRDKYTTIMCVEYYKRLYENKEIKNLFLENCCSGLIYDSIVGDIEEKYKSEDASYFNPSWTFKRKRGFVKNVLLNQIFANPNNPDHNGLYSGKNEEILESFATLYHEPYTVIQAIKKINYLDVSKLLTRIESVAMQGFVCKRLLRDFPEMPLATLHDALLTVATNDYANTLKQVMLEEITRFMSCTPSTKVTNWA